MNRMNKLTLAMALAGVAISSSSYAAVDPTKLEVTLYKTEVYNSSTANWITVLDDSTGVAIDFMGSLDKAFGEASVSEGVYNKIRFSLGNEITYSAPIDGACAAVTDGTFSIDGSAAAGAQTSLVFSTEGSTSWRANGTDSNPYLMNGSVEIVDGQHTDVELALNATGSVSCSGSTMAVSPPSFDVSSRVVVSSTTAAFTGGDYWMVGASHHAATLTCEVSSDPGCTNGVGNAIEDGTYVDAGGNTIASGYGGLVSNFEYLTSSLNTVNQAAYAAQLLTRVTREHRWGMKVSLGAMGADGTGTVSVKRNFGFHRHSSNDAGTPTTFQQEPSTDDATATAMGTYVRSAGNRFTLLLDDGAVLHGALSRDHEMFVIMNSEQYSRSSELNIGVKVNTGETTLVPTDTLMSWNKYRWTFNKQSQTDPDRAYNIDTEGELGWVKINDNQNGTWTILQSSYGSDSRIDDVFGTVATTFNNGQGDSWSNQVIPDQASFNSFFPAVVDGAGMVAGGEEWMASSPSGNVFIGSVAQDATNNHDGDAIPDDHSMGFLFAMKQAASGTHTASTLAGTYVFSMMKDKVNDVDGIVASGSVHGEYTLLADGRIEYQVVERRSDGVVSVQTHNTAGAGITPKFSVESVCFGQPALVRDAHERVQKHYDGVTGFVLTETGNATDSGDVAYYEYIAEKGAVADNTDPSAATTTGETRLAHDAADCDVQTGQTMDVVIGYHDDGSGAGVWGATTQRFLAMMVSADGNAMTMVDPKQFDGEGERSLGYAVRIE